MNITRTALKFNTTVYVLIACIIVIGAMSYRGLPLEAAPEVKVPMMIVSTVYPRVSPQDMERLVTNVLERELGDLKGLKKMSSSSTESVSAVTVVDEKLNLPEGYSVNYAGESADQEESSTFLGSAFGIGLMLMALILITQFNSVVRPGIVLGSVVMSMVGVLVGLMITQNKFGIIMTGLGVISLAGVVVNNAIVLIDYTDQLKDKLNVPLKEALAKAGVIRFRPVLLTAITTILGLVPMALGISINFKTLQIDVGAPTTEMWGPMAQAVIFGLTFATVLTLIIVPVMYQQQINTQQWLKAARGSMAAVFTRYTKRRCNKVCQP